MIKYEITITTQKYKKLADEGNPLKYGEGIQWFYVYNVI